MNAGRTLMKAINGDGLGSIDSVVSNNNKPHIAIGTRVLG
jgi:hypothetical protein